MRRIVLFLLIFGAGLGVLLGISYLRKQERAERIPDDQEERVREGREENLPFTPIPETVIPETGGETSPDEQGGIVFHGEFECTVREESDRAGKLYYFRGTAEPLGEDLYDIFNITAHTFDPETEEVRSTIVAERGRARIENAGRSPVIGDAERVKLYDAVATLHAGVPLAPVILYLPEGEADLSGEAVYSDVPVRVEGDGLRTTSLGLIARYGENRLRLVRDGHVWLRLEDGSEVELLSKGLDPIDIDRLSISEDSEEITVSVTDGGRVETQGEQKLTLDGRELERRGVVQTADRDGDGVTERVFVPDQAHAIGDVVIVHEEGRFTSGEGFADFNEVGELEHLTMIDEPVVGGWIEAELEEERGDERLYVEISGVGPLVVDYHPDQEYADFDLPGPARAETTSGEFELDASEKIDGRLHADGTLGMFLRGEVEGQFRDLDFEGTDVELTGTETNEGAQKILVQTEDPAHITGEDRRGRPVDITTKGSLKVLFDRKKLSIPLAREAVVEVESEDPWRLEVGEIQDFEVEEGTFRAEGGVRYRSGLGGGTATRARGYSTEHVEFFGVPETPAEYDLATGLVEGVEQGQIRAQQISLQPDFAHAEGKVELRSSGAQGTQEIDCEWLEIRFEADPRLQDETGFEFEGREVTRCFIRDERAETTVNTRFVKGHGSTRVGESGESGETELELIDIEAFAGVTLDHRGRSAFIGSGERFTWSPLEGARLEARSGERVSARGRFRPEGLPYQLTATWIEFIGGSIEGLSPEITLDLQAALPQLQEGRNTTELHSAKADWMSTDELGLLLTGNAHFTGRTRQGRALQLDAGSLHITQATTEGGRSEDINDMVAWDGFVLTMEDDLVGRGEILQADYRYLRMEGRPAELDVQGFLWESDNLTYDVQRVLVTTDQGRLIGAADSEWAGWTAAYESLRPFETPDSTIMVMRNPVLRSGEEEVRGQWALFWVDRSEWIDTTQEWLGERGRSELPMPPRTYRDEEQDDKKPVRAPTLFGRFDAEKISKTLKEVYFEGDIEYLVNGETKARMDSMYIDMVDGHGWLQGCELWLDTSISNTPTRLAVRADWLRHSADGSLHADHAEITACSFAEPDYYIRSKDMRLVPVDEGASVWDVRLKSNRLAFKNGLAIPLPPVHYKSDGKGRPAIDSFRFGGSPRFGSFVRAALNLELGEGVTNAAAKAMDVEPRDVSGGWHFDAAYYGARGIPLGIGTHIRAGDKFWLDTNLTGIYDRGKDKGILKYKTTIDDELRWTFYTQSRYLITNEEWVDFVWSTQSDPGVQSEFQEGQFVRYERRDTYAHWRKARKENYYSAMLRVRADGFRNDVERLPDLGMLHGLTPFAEFAGVPLLYTATGDVAYLLRKEGSSDLVSPWDPLFDDGLGSRESFRADTRHRVEAPFDLNFAGIRVAPFAGVMGTAWSKGVDVGTSPSRGAVLAGVQAESSFFRTWSQGVVHGLTPSVGVRGDLGTFEADGQPVYYDHLDSSVTGKYVDLGLRSRWRVPGGFRFLDIALTQSHGEDVPNRRDGWQPLVALGNFLGVIYGVPIAIDQDARYDLDDGETVYSFSRVSILPFDDLGLEWAYHRGLDEDRLLTIDAMSVGAHWEASSKWQIEGRQTISQLDNSRLASTFLVRRDGHDFVFEVTYGFRQGDGGSSLSFRIRPKLGWRRPSFGKMRLLRRARP